ncbi:MAG: 6-bladed beta-propeller [Thermodesulfovibrionales bacterium]|nr:6-bladed beta-propeller [Thermodesulfovibrionales bacterium]
MPAFISCESVRPEKWDPYSLQWPEKTPRIKYHSSIMSELDVIEKRDIVDKISGEARRPVRLLKPYGVTTDDLGRLYVSDIGRIFVFDKKEKRLLFFEETGRPKRPLGMFYDRKDRLLYVADGELNKVYVFTVDGKLLLEIGNNDELLRPGGVAVDSLRDRVYVTNTGRHTVSVFNTKGQFLGNIGTRGNGPGQFNFPTQITIDREGRIYVVDTGNFRIQILEPGEDFMVFDKEIGSHGTAYGELGRPKGISLDSDGNIFIADAMFHGITVFNREGKVLLAWGKRGFRPGLFELPAGLHIDEYGFIYVVSQGNARVDIFEVIK